MTKCASCGRELFSWNEDLASGLCIDCARNGGMERKDAHTREVNRPIPAQTGTPDSGQNASLKAVAVLVTVILGIAGAYARFAVRQKRMDAMREQAQQRPWEEGIRPGPRHWPNGAEKGTWQPRFVELSREAQHQPWIDRRPDEVGFAAPAPQARAEPASACPWAEPIARIAGAKPVAPPPGKEESRKFLGTWQCVSWINDGKKEADEEVKKLTWVLRAGGYFKVLRGGEVVTEGVQRDVDPTKTPKTLNQWIGEAEHEDDRKPDTATYDGKPVLGSVTGKVHAGIYLLDADMLEVCTTPADKPRPSELGSKPGSGHVYSVWKRLAPAKDLQSDPPATWCMRQLMRRGCAEAQDVESPPQRPSPERVARRAMVLALMVYRASVERFPGEAKFEALHGRLPTWVEQIGLASELEKEEDAFLRAPLGKADRQAVIDGGWRAEGLAVLAWALGRLELPAYDVGMDPRKAVPSVGLSDELLSAMDTAPAKKLFREAKLRPAAEIDRYACQITIVHWRLRSYRMSRGENGQDFKRMAFGAYLRGHPSFKETWLEGLRLVGDDLAIGGEAIGDAPPDAVEECAGIVMERHPAAYWLQGDHETYSQADSPTVLFGLE